MLEAVGERYWDAYFAALDRHLAPGGRIGLQTITMPHDRMLATRHTYTWIQKYIFPGGLLPSVTAIGDSLARTTLRITGREDFGAHYAETLRIWRERFGARADEVARLGFDEVFNRMWTFYLCYSEAGFRAGYIDVSQLTLARTMSGAMSAPKGAAEVIAALLAQAGLDLPVRLRAWDGSEAGPLNPWRPVLVVRSPRALQRILWRPGELGLARAYVSGDLDVEGDLTDGLRRVHATAPRSGPFGLIKTGPAVVAAASRLGLLTRPLEPPRCELRVRGRRHSRARDQAVIAGHYDVPSAFYQLILDPAWPTRARTGTRRPWTWPRRSGPSST
jgi:Cyclopropane fatty acid synthase and related methyltransferases